ncbi:SANT/Myb domain [Dillenia turbinata]|uniref:SANT/Myb domain n=1 Tax=Dillenia turbinata TaxID=194707 RepID=A0AAN8VJU0_9MAGN
MKVAANTEAPKKKERHIVTWSQQEDDLLRELIRNHGTENWGIIASKFKDKTTRQCRRRWYTYLNCDSKKGGWSPEEDLLLCEAQRIFGNRWTEIAKVVSGRTDNAVKNRFSTLCKKKAKREALAKENNSFINPNNKRILVQNVLETSATSVAFKKMRRTQVSNLMECSNDGGRLLLEGVTASAAAQQLRPPFAVLAQNTSHIVKYSGNEFVCKMKEASDDASNVKGQGTFLKKNDPKITALMQQADLLSSLAQKVNSDNTYQSLENAWKVLQDFLNQSKESNTLSYCISDMDFQLENFKDLIEELRSCNRGCEVSFRQPDLYESPCSSEYSTGSTLMSNKAGDKTEQPQAEACVLHQDIRSGLEFVQIREQDTVSGCKDEIISTVSAVDADQAEDFPPCDEQNNYDRAISALSSSEFSSPLQVTPLFRSLAAGIPSPKFSESERNFLLKTLGFESQSLDPSNNTSQPPPCRRALLNSL